MEVLDGPVGMHFRRILSECDRRLTEQGELRVLSGSLPWADGVLDIHTDYGPSHQDKDVNQDYVAAWTACTSAGDKGVAWAVAMADGVTSSYFAEIGAEVACRVGLARIVLSKGHAHEKAREGMKAAGDAIGLLADTIESDADGYRPEGEFASSWRYTLKEGLLLQTTLTLAWLEGGEFNLAIVGDGGAAIQRIGEESAVLADVNEETNRVHALGPANRHVSEMDHWELIEADSISLVALYTDGIGRIVGVDGRDLVDLIEAARRACNTRNTSESVIHDLMRDCCTEIDDNLTLATILCLPDS